MSGFQPMGNVILATMEASVQLANSEQNDLLYTANIAITISSGLSKLMQQQQETESAIMQGNYGSGIFDGYDSNNDPGFQDSSNDNAVPLTQACLSAAQSGFQGWISSLTSVMSAMTQQIQSAQQTISQTFQFPQQVLELQSFTSQLTSNPMTA
ncbi:hypothetical protein [Simkania sp.]|uniref:hypothetical protein n=1 Tax=Simkania sp. TaxID=34094 RepID=UPI003B51A42F